ncbi:hypothetical protein KAR91_33735 [Candidatus Pacearchaeota archaeon]|nr:hypothetical protein [Candidatus Pacearchaeota archaeon]
MKQQNIILLTYERLHELLGLHDDLQVINVVQSADDSMNQRVQVLVQGEGLMDVIDGGTPCWIPLEDFRKKEPDPPLLDDKMGRRELVEMLGKIRGRCEDCLCEADEISYQEHLAKLSRLKGDIEDLLETIRPEDGS